MIKILEGTLKHVEEEKLDQTTKGEVEGYEWVDQEVIKLMEEKQEWELLLIKLQDKLDDLSRYRR